MREFRRKVLLPVFRLSELTTEDDPLAIEQTIKQGKSYPAMTYHYRFVWDDSAGHGFNYNLLPVVLDKNAAPWPLGTLYILAQLEAQTNPVMTTCQSKADDLGAYKEWLDTHDEPDDVMCQFPKIKLRRVTYRYRGHLQRQVQAGEVAPGTAKRRMGTVVALYRWLIGRNYLQPDNPPWEERLYQITFRSIEGRALSKRVVSTDVSIRAPKSEDPFSGTIMDGGQLRPLTCKEQGWVLEATQVKGNTECYLLQLFMLATGARIQTAGTLRLRHFAQANPSYAKALAGDGEVYKLKAGPGTGIDTKNDKRGVLQVPRSIYELLHTYALSDRAKVRSSRFFAKHGEHSDPYLFFTQQGSPYFTAKADVQRFDVNFDRRYEKTGQPVRQFIKEHVIPYIREKYDSSFKYRMHDLRASFGMNMTELLMGLVYGRKITLHQARMAVKDLLWHESLTTTDLYLNYRSHSNIIYEAVNGYGEQLQKWVAQASLSGEVKDE